MLIESFRSHPMFPFSHYFEDPNHYTEAQRYWLTLLRQSDGFEEADWHPHIDMPALPAAMYEGVVASVVNPKLQKAIRLATTSVEGMAHMLVLENGPMSEADLKMMQDLSPETPIAAKYKDGLSEVDAGSEAQALQTLAPISCEVEDMVMIDAQGEQITIERLILVGHIDPTAEPMARQALDLFLQSGPARTRVHTAFPDPID